MKKRFQSKVDLFILLPVLLLLLAGEIYMISIGMKTGIIGVSVSILFVLYVWYDTIYIFTEDNRLMIRIGFFYHKEIYIKSIKKVRPTKDHSASPALSFFDRLEIRYHRYGRIVVSPNNKFEFIKRLQQVNPKIITE